MIREEIIGLAKDLIGIQTVSVGGEPRLGEIRRATEFLEKFLRDAGLEVRVYDRGGYPAVLAGFPEQLSAPVMLGGHYDVVAPEPDDSQFYPRIDGDYLIGRGAADMKSVVATYLVWMKHRVLQGPPFPPINLLLVGNEERGEDGPMGTAHVLADLKRESGPDALPSFFIAGERTEEVGNDIWGKICTENRGVMRFELVAMGRRSHSGLPGKSADLTAQLTSAKQDLEEIATKYLTLESDVNWRSQLRFPFIQVGERGVYNITADTGVLGVEIRPIPQDDLDGLITDLYRYCTQNDLNLEGLVSDPGISCDLGNPYLQALKRAVQEESGEKVKFGKKLAGTSARFAPYGQGVIWGQSGIGPHANDERHFIPSIMPYFKALDRFADLLEQFVGQKKLRIG
jgi:acetylornithine deacetylase/succinyl-diaminopimelate desuccinylase-like protein